MKKLNITDPCNPEYCCGNIMENKFGVQIRIDRMQLVIDQAHQLLNYGDVPDDIISDLKKELEVLSSD